MALVKQAIARVAEVGVDKAMPWSSWTAQWQICRSRPACLIVINKGRPSHVAHGQNPKLVGKLYFDTVDVNGKEYKASEVQQIAAGPGKALVHLRVQGPDHRQERCC